MFADLDKDKHEQDNERLQADLEMLEKWSDEWLLRFNAAKYNAVHIGHQQDTSYQMSVTGNMRKLEAIRDECDLCVFITNKPETNRAMQ